MTNLRISQFGGVQAGSGEGAPVDASPGVAGTGAGAMAPGSLLSDVTNGILYLNTGSKASPTWTRVGPPAA